MLDCFSFIISSPKFLLVFWILNWKNIKYKLFNTVVFSNPFFYNYENIHLCVIICGYMRSLIFPLSNLWLLLHVSSVLHIQQMLLQKRLGQCAPAFQNMWLLLQRLLDQCYSQYVLYFDIKLLYQTFFFLFFFFFTSSLLNWRWNSRWWYILGSSCNCYWSNSIYFVKQSNLKLALPDAFRPKVDRCF